MRDMLEPSRAIVFFSLLAAVGAVNAEAQVRFAEPADAVLHALFPTLDATTGTTPVAEPAIAAGRRPPREVRGENCISGFRIAENQTAEWSVQGHNYLLSLFLVTTDAKRGIPAPCYKPEAWACVLDKTSSGLRPVDCAWIDPAIQFPENIALDTAAFALNETERAFGVRVGSEFGQRFWSETNETLLLFRLQHDSLREILTIPVRTAHEDFTDDRETCSRELIVSVDRAKTQGFFHWRVRTGKKSGRASCDLDSVGTYRWDGQRYVKR